MTSNDIAKQESARGETAAMLPPVDVVEDDSGITLYADLPGVPKDKLNVRVEADALTIEAEVSLPLAQGMEASYAEVQLPRYRRTFTLGQELDSDKAVAEFRNGVLRLHIPKAAHARPRRIEVQVG
ncbi:MAG: Hsp20/alpha crystallin family protein [Rhodocyclaceae bacterium]